MKSFDLQRPTIPLWKDLKLAVNIVSAQESGSILKIENEISRYFRIFFKSLLPESVFKLNFRTNIAKKATVVNHS